MTKSNKVAHAEYLHGLSLYVYRLLHIIRTHSKEPVDIDKELMRLYSIQKQKLENLILRKPNDLNIKLNTDFLKLDLISNFHDTEKNKNDLEVAKNALYKMLSKIQALRDNTASANTGFEDDYLERYLDKVNKNKKGLVIEQLSSNDDLWVTKNKDQYFYDGKPVYIKSNDTNYVKIFDVVYSLQPEGGQISYNDIIQGLKERNIRMSNNQPILRALSGKSANFFRYVTDIKKSTPRGIDLFTASKTGKYIEFNNKKN